jgi:hypothetical protein
MSKTPDLLILGAPDTEQPPDYRGTGRSWPYYVESEPAGSRANEAFSWFTSEHAGRGVVHDVMRARELVAAYRKLDPPQPFEIVEVTPEGAEPKYGSNLLGYDLTAHYNNSLLGGYLLAAGGLDLSREPEGVAPDDPFWLLRPLMRLTQLHFQPRLNANGLFQDLKTAQFCLECMRSLEGCRPNLWGDLPFEVVGLWRISDE